MDRSCFMVKVIYGLKIRILGCMFSRINYVCMPHKGWMKNDYSITQNGWNCKSNLNSLPNTSRRLLILALFPTSLNGFSPFSWWPLIFHFSSVTYVLRHRHLRHVCSFPPPLLHSTRFIQCWSLCDLHVAPAIFAQMFNFCILRSFCEIIVMLPSI